MQSITQSNEHKNKKTQTAMNNKDNSYKLVSTAEYLLWVDTQNAGVCLDTCIDIEGKIFFYERHYPQSIGQRKIIAFRPLNDNAPLLEGRPLLPTLPKQEEDIQRIAEKLAIEGTDGGCIEGNHSHDCCCCAFEEGYVTGYKAATSSNKRYGLDIDQIEEWATQKFLDIVPTLSNEYRLFMKTIREYIKSLSPTLDVLPKEFIPTFLTTEEKFNLGTVTANEQVFKTIKSNCRGNDIEVLCGTYKF